MVPFPFSTIHPTTKKNKNQIAVNPGGGPRPRQLVRLDNQPDGETAGGRQRKPGWFHHHGMDKCKDLQDWLNWQNWQNL